MIEKHRITQSANMTKVLPQVPKIINVVKDGWSYYFYEEFKDLFDDLENNPLIPYTGIDTNSFRIQVSFKTVSFLVGIFPSEKEFRFYTPRLNHELFLLNNLESSGDKEFREHTKKVATLSPKLFPSQIEINTKVFKLENLENVEKYDPIEKETNQLVEKLLVNMNNYRPSFLEKISDMALSLAAQYSLIRVHLLKFLAILPSLDYDPTGKEIKRILLETFRRLQNDNKLAIAENRKEQDRPLPWFLILLIKVANFFSTFLPPGILSSIVKFNVRFMAKRFIAGETIESAEKSLENIYKTGRDVTLDQLGELVVSEKEADHYQDEVIKLIKGFSLHVKKGEKNKAGINRAHVSIKVSALCSDFKPYARNYTFNLVAPRLKKILIEAKANDVFINIDAEHYHYRDIVFYIYKRVLLETNELKDFSSTGIVLQAYLRDSYTHLLEILELSKERKIVMPVRLVKGAYWDAETIEADAHGHEAPQFLNKEETDINFRQMAEEILKASSLQLCLASHNFADHCYVEALRKKLYPNSPVIEHQCLHMTYEALSTALAEMGLPVRNYVPVGSLLVGMAYLVRRIMENSSQVGILTIMRSHKNLKKIQVPEKIHQKNKKLDELKKDLTSASLSGDFFNVPPVRIYLPTESELAKKALADFAAKNLNTKYPNSLPLNGENYKVVCNSDSNIVLGEIQYANADDTKAAIDSLKTAYLDGIWSQVPWITRSSCLLKAARIMVAKRNYLASLMVYEGGKIFSEALADVDEAIDFLSFYAHEEGRIHKENSKIEARGVIGVISPWNFPLAIPCGMVTSALVAGNSVILKSARPTPLIAQKLIDILHEANIPKNVVVHLPGKGSEVGETIVESPDIAGIVFTGSKAVGLSMAHKASKRLVRNKKNGGKIPAKVIAEMGGKNAIIVTSNAELDEAVSGILYSAFGHSGQKCSAASRVLVDLKIKDKLVERLKAACLDLKVGEAFEFSSTMNPIISMEERNRLRDDVAKAIEEAKAHNGIVHVDRSNEKLPGSCMGPVLIELPTERGLNHQSFSTKELFGPVVHVIGYNNLDEAIKIFNGTEYALTGGMFSQSQDDIDYLMRKLESGNVYINRGITGARVGIEPFGGFKMSGTGPKAGGKSYVPSFHVAPLNLPSESENIKLVPPDEEGESYEFDLCLPTSFEGKELRMIFDEGMEKLIQNFENLFDGIYGNQKEVLINFRHYAFNNLKDFKNKKVPNREIPGQLSYNDQRFLESQIVVAAYEPRAYFSTLMEVLVAISMGIGVSVLARNQTSFIWWNNIRSIFYKHSKERSLDVFFPNQKIFEKALNNNDLRTIIVDGGEEEVKRVLKIVYNNSYSEKYMRQILTPLDSPNVSDFDALMEKVVFVRSFAVNIMRHGAPMSVQ